MRKLTILKLTDYTYFDKKADTGSDTHKQTKDMNTHMTHRTRRHTRKQITQGSKKRQNSLNFTIPKMFLCVRVIIIMRIVCFNPFYVSFSSDYISKCWPSTLLAKSFGSPTNTFIYWYSKI